MPTAQSLSGLAQLYSDLGRDLTRLNSTADAFAALSSLAVDVVPGAQQAGVTHARRGGFETIAATGPLATDVDRIQYALDDGPCVDATQDGSVFRTGDLRTDDRWPVFGRLAVEQCGVNSMLAVRLFAEPTLLRGAALNMYSTERDAFADSDVVLATLLASHGAIALAAAEAREQVTNLLATVQKDHDIDIAVGMLMAQHGLGADEAFSLLCIASQHGNRDLPVIAREVADGRALDLPGDQPMR